jgi:hypothetical protein
MVSILTSWKKKINIKNRKKGIGGIHHWIQNKQATLSLKVENQCFHTPILIGRHFSLVYNFSSQHDQKIETAGL